MFTEATLKLLIKMYDQNVIQKQNITFWEGYWEQVCSLMAFSMIMKRLVVQIAF